MAKFTTSLVILASIFLTISAAPIPSHHGVMPIPIGVSAMGTNNNSASGGQSDRPTCYPDPHDHWWDMSDFFGSEGAYTNGRAESAAHRRTLPRSKCPEVEIEHELSVEVKVDDTN